jgi:hypothetical protein
MKITPVHHAILCYLEWHCDRRLPFRTVRRMARDLARNETEVQRATRQLIGWGLFTMRHDQRNQSFIVRLGDGRETTPYRPIRMAAAPPISTTHWLKNAAVHMGRQATKSLEWRSDETRIAA